MAHWRTTFRKDPAFHPACEAPVLSDPERRWADAESPEWGSPATAPALQQVWPTRAAVLQAIVLLLERWFSWQDSRRGQNKKNRKYAICANTGTVTRRTRDHAAGEVALRCDYAKSIVHSVRYTARRSMFHQAPFGIPCAWRTDEQSVSEEIQSLRRIAQHSKRNALETGTMHMRGGCLL